MLEGVGPLEAIIVDGYAWLAPGRPGLGAKLHEATGVPVIGVAKTRFRDAPAVEVLRGRSAKPLYVTAAGMASDDAGRAVASMAGADRTPVLLRRVDRLAREGP